MEPLGAYIDFAVTASAADFADKHPHPWLVLAIEGLEGPNWRRFRTTNISRDLLAAGKKSRSNIEQFRVFEIRKHSDNPWPDRVSLGRARNNDLVIQDRSISKLHAHFWFDAQGMAQLRDASSKNGTLVNGDSLGLDDAVPLRSGDELTFGRIDALFYDSQKFYDFLIRMRGA